MTTERIELVWGYAEPYGDLGNYMGFFSPEGELLHFRTNDEAEPIIKAMTKPTEVGYLCNKCGFRALVQEPSKELLEIMAAVHRPM